MSYDGIYTLATTLRNAHMTANRRGLRTALASLEDVPSVLSASGHFSFTATRELDLTPLVRTVLHGRFVRFS